MIKQSTAIIFYFIHSFCNIIQQNLEHKYNFKTQFRYTSIDTKTSKLIKYGRTAKNTQIYIQGVPKK